MKTLNKNYFIASLAIHLCIVLSINYIIRRDTLENKNFIIFGAHSRYTTQAIYKSSTPVPFTSTLVPKNSPAHKKDNKKATRVKKINTQKASKKIAAAKKVQKTTPTINRNNAQAVAISAPTAITKNTTKKTIPKKKRSQLTQAKQTAPVAMLKSKEVVKKTVPKLKIEEKKIVPLPVKPIALPEQLRAKPLTHEIKNDTAVLDAASEKIPIVPITDAAINVDVPEKPIPQDLTDTPEDNFDEPVHVGIVNASDPVTRYHQRVLSEEISRLWKPPVGVRKGTECSALLTFNADGSLKVFDFVKRSNVPIYDLSILRLKLAKFKLPLDFRINKPLLVVFHQ